MRQLQQAVTELEQTATPAKPTDATPVTIVETTDVQRSMLNYAQTAGSYLGPAVLLMFLIYFLLASGEMFKLKLVKLSGERLSQKKVTVQMIDEITTQIGRFVFYQFWSGLLVGVLTWLAFMWMGVRYAGLVGRGGRRPQLHSVLRSDDHHGGVRGGRGPAVPIALDGRTGRARVTRDHVARGLRARADRAGTRRQRELGRDLRGGDVLGLDVGRARPDHGGADADDRQDRGRSRRVDGGHQRAARRTRRVAKGHTHCIAVSPITRETADGRYLHTYEREFA